MYKQNGSGPNNELNSTLKQRLEIAIRYYHTAQYYEALLACESAIQLDPDCARAHHGRGLILTQQKEYKAALEAYRRASELAPGNAKIHADVGELYYISHDLEKSRQSYEKAIQLDSKYKDVYHRKTMELVDSAVDLVSRGSRYEAIATLQEAIVFNPTNQRAQFFLSGVEKNFPPTTSAPNPSPSSSPSIHSPLCRCHQCMNY